MSQRHRISASPYLRVPASPRLRVFVSPRPPVSPSPRLRVALAALALLSLAACNAPRVTREAETARFKTETSARLAALKVSPAETLTQAQCEELAVGNNLSYRVTLLQTRLQDDQVRLALADQLPDIRAQYGKSRRNNAPLVNGPGGGTFQFDDQSLDRFNLRAAIPIFDFGSTYFAYQIAKDRRLQERLVAVRARQLLLRDVRVAYTHHAAAIRQEQLARSAVEAATEILRVAQSLQREGLNAPSDTAFVEATLARAGLELLLAQRNIEDTRLRLNQTMSLPPWTEYKIDAALPELPPLATADKKAELEAAALRARPELFAQDIERHISANEVRRRVAAFFPRIDGLADFNWSTLSTVVNPVYATFGFTVSQTLLDGASNINRYSSAKKRVEVEQERALLLAMGVLFDVDFRVQQIFRTHDSTLALAKVAETQQVLLKHVTSQYREGLETGANAARALAELRNAQRELDQAQAEYLAAWIELNASALPGETEPADSAAEKLETEGPGDGETGGQGAGATGRRGDTETQ